MTLIIELNPSQEASLILAASQTGLEPSELAQKMIAQNLPPIDSAPLSPEERILKMDNFAEKNHGLPILSNSAFDHEAIYEGRL